MTTTAFDPKMADEICCRMAAGESLRAICRDLGVPESTARQWAIDDRDGFAARYREARALLVEHWADEIIAIADDDQLEPNDRRVKIDTRKWLMAKLAPRRYGDRLLHAGDPADPIRIEVADLGRLSVAELEALERFAQARLIGAAALDGH